MAVDLTTLLGPEFAEYINSLLKGSHNANALINVPTRGESIDMYKFCFDGLFFSAGPSTSQLPSYQESLSNAESIQPVQIQASYEDNAFEDCEIDGDDVQIDNFTNNNNGGTGGAWVPPVKSTAFRGAKIRGKAKIASNSDNGNSCVRK